MHSHDDAACLSTPLDFKLMQGVTTDVLDNCGAGIAPYNPEQRANVIVGNVLGEMPEATWRTFGEFMRVVEQARPAIKVACLMPHGAVRYATLGMQSREPEHDELDQMRAHIDEGMAAGAVGLSTGLIYPPGAFARTGRSAEGAFADVVVFDPQRIEDVATYEEPRQYPAGIDYVLINGRVAAEGGQQVESSAGRLLRRGQA